MPVSEQLMLIPFRRIFQSESGCLPPPNALMNNKPNQYATVADIDVVRLIQEERCYKFFSELHLN